jgi:hypothetical protein
MMTTDGNRDESIDKSTTRVFQNRTGKHRQFYLEIEDSSTRMRRAFTFPHFHPWRSSQAQQGDRAWVGSCDQIANGPETY